jgi:hypothetical protein
VEYAWAAINFVVIRVELVASKIDRW